MEKRNIIVKERTPEFEKQATYDKREDGIVKLFKEKKNGQSYQPNSERVVQHK